MRHYSKISVLTLIAVTATFAACQKVDSPVAQLGAPVQFSANVANEYVMKSTIDNPIDNGEFVGVYAGAPIGANNKKYSKTTDLMTLTPVGDANTIKWLVGQNGTQSFYAYYPYKDGATESSIPVAIATDQSTLENLNASDFLWGSDVDRTAGTASSITLNHKLTKVIINIDNNLASDVTKVEITGLKNTALAAPTTADLSNRSGSDPITAYHDVSGNGWSDGDNNTNDTRNRRYVAIVLPDANVSPNIVITVAGNLVYTYTLSGAYTFVSGTTATADITIDPGSSEAGSAAEFSFSLGNWTAGSVISITSGTPTPTKPENKWSIIGTINGTNWDQDFYLNQTETVKGGEAHEGTWEGDFDYNKNEIFKLRFNNAWTTQAGMDPSWQYCNIGENELGLWGSGNIDIVLANSGSKDGIVSGSYHIKFIYDGYKLTVTKNNNN